MDRKIKNILDDLEIQYKWFEHEPLFTCKDADNLFYNPQSIKTGKPKNLFLRNQKGTEYFLVIMSGNKIFNIKDFGNRIKTKLGFASPKRLKKILDLIPGSVSPFGLLNDKNRQVRVFLDLEFLESDYLYFHPIRNTASVRVTREDLFKLLDFTGHKYEVVDI